MQRTQLGGPRLTWRSQLTIAWTWGLIAFPFAVRCGQWASQRKPGQLSPEPRNPDCADAGDGIGRGLELSGAGDLLPGGVLTVECGLTVTKRCPSDTDSEAYLCRKDLDCKISYFHAEAGLFVASPSNARLSL